MVTMTGIAGDEIRSVRMDLRGGRHADAEFLCCYLAPFSEGRIMDFLNRFVDRPLLLLGSRAMWFWHGQTGLSPRKLAPLWHVSVILALAAAARLFLEGPVYGFAVGTLMMLAFPSIRLLIFGEGSRNYDMRSYRGLAAQAAHKRDAEWAIRLTVLFTSAVLPFCVYADDQSARFFLFGASLWFVLTAPAKLYLDAAEPPPPDSGDALAHARRAMFPA